MGTPSLIHVQRARLEGAAEWDLHRHLAAAKAEAHTHGECAEILPSNPMC